MGKELWFSRMDASWRVIGDKIYLLMENFPLKMEFSSVGSSRKVNLTAKENT